MKTASDGAKVWAREEFDDVEVGDRRRRERVIKMAAVTAAPPLATVGRTYDRGADRQAAYDLLEPHVGHALRMCMSFPNARRSVRVECCAS